MAKSSGTTKGGNKSNPRGLASGGVKLGSFVKNGTDEWILSSPTYSAYINSEYDVSGDRTFEVTIVDANGRALGDTGEDIFDSLNEAKKEAKNRLRYLLNREND